MSYSSISSFALCVLLFFSGCGDGGKDVRNSPDGVAVYRLPDSSEHFDGGVNADSHSAANIPAAGQSSVDSVSVLLFMVEASGDSGKGLTFGCGDILVGRKYRVRNGETLQVVLQETFRALLAPENAGPQNFVVGARLDSVAVAGRIAQVYLGGRIILAGVCDHPRVEEQLRRTATQFPGIDSAVIYVGTERLEDYLRLK